MGTDVYTTRGTGPALITSPLQVGQGLSPDSSGCEPALATLWQVELAYPGWGPRMEQVKRVMKEGLDVGQNWVPTQ